MNPNREEVLFQLALEKPADKRAAFLDAVREGDTALPEDGDDPVNVAKSAIAQFPDLYRELADELSAAGRTNEAVECRRRAAALTK